MGGVRGGHVICKGIQYDAGWQDCSSIKWKGKFCLSANHKSTRLIPSLSLPLRRSVIPAPLPLLWAELAEIALVVESQYVSWHLRVLTVRLSLKKLKNSTDAGEKQARVDGQHRAAQEPLDSMTRPQKISGCKREAAGYIDSYTWNRSLKSLRLSLAIESFGRSFRLTGKLQTLHCCCWSSSTVLLNCICSWQTAWGTVQDIWDRVWVLGEGWTSCLTVWRLSG